MAILISGKINSRAKTIARDKKGHFKMIKGLIYEENITILNGYVPNNRASIHINKKKNYRTAKRNR